jgi:hypothetical protein
MDVVKTAWAFIWIAIAAGEVGLSAWFHSPNFLALGTVAVLMVAFNLYRRVRIAARALAATVA